MRRIRKAAICAVGVAALSLPACRDARGGEPTRENYLQLASEMDAGLRTLLAAWYPRCIDREAGGFHERFARDWTRRPDTGKFLVYQARMTWVAAEAATYAPELRDEYAAYARHGLRFLLDVMRDAKHGGVHFRVGPRGEAPAGEEKHAYGISFAIYAGAAVYRHLGDEAGLRLARKTFRWLDRHAHDAANGGYFESLAADGRPELEHPGWKLDAIGTLRGYKSMNSHIHLLEAFTELYRAAPEPLLRARLEELLSIVRDRIAVDPGCLNLFFTPSWRPVPAHDSFGHDIETGYLLIEAAEALGRPEDPATWGVARKLVDHALRWGFDTRYGGFFEKGEAFAPAHDTSKVWWTQAEGLNVLLLMHERYGKETERYHEAFRKQWDFIKKHVIDPRYPGWFGHVSREGELLGAGDKASPWKAAYHNGRALMNCVRRLRELAAEE